MFSQEYFLNKTRFCCFRRDGVMVVFFFKKNSIHSFSLLASSSCEAIFRLLLGFPFKCETFFGTARTQNASTYYTSVCLY